MTRRTTIAAAVLAALCTLSACGDDTGGEDGWSPSAGTEEGAEGQTGGAEDGSGDADELTGATVIPADQSDVTPAGAEGMCDTAQAIAEAVAPYLPED